MCQFPLYLYIYVIYVYLFSDLRDKSDKKHISERRMASTDFFEGANLKRNMEAVTVADEPK